MVTANCVHSIETSIPKDYYFLIGQFNSEANEYSTVKMGVSKIILHPGYIPNEHENNLAVCVLKSTVQITPICLPSPKKSIDDIFSKSLYVIGWEPIFAKGRTSPIGNAKFLPSKPVNKQTCSKTYSNDVPISKGQYFCLIKDDQTGKGPCDGIL